MLLKDSSSCIRNFANDNSITCHCKTVAVRGGALKLRTTRAPPTVSVALTLAVFPPKLSVRPAHSFFHALRLPVVRVI